jgi:aminoglycoside phosphotransferase (APT) family kinase protein
VAFIDFDTLQRGDAAVDLANLAVHLELRAMQAGEGVAAAAPLRAALLEGYGAGPALTERLAPYEAAVRLRLACVYAFRPRWAGLPLELLAYTTRSASSVGVRSPIVA